MELNPYQSSAEVRDAPAIDALPVAAPIESAKERCCGICQGREFKEWRWWHPLLLHWIINPGLAVNELFIGTRIPAQTFNCTNCFGWKNSSAKNRYTGQYVECPHCERFHPMELWRFNVMNWLGLVCPDCGEFIPCVLDLTSAVILFVLFPIWWPLSLLVKPAYKRWAMQRAAKARNSRGTAVA